MIDPLNHLPLVTMVMKQLHIPPHLWDDMEQEGRIGILNAIKTYNPGLGFKQSTHISAHIKYSILRSLRSLRGPNPAKCNFYHINYDRLRRIQEGYEYPKDVMSTVAKNLSYIPEYSSNVIYQDIIGELNKLSSGEDGIFVQCYLLSALEEKTLLEIKEILHINKATTSICRMVNRGKVIVYNYLRKTYIEVFNHPPIQEAIEEIKRWATSDLDIKNFLGLCIDGKKLPSNHRGIIKIKEKYPSLYRDIISTLNLGKRMNKTKP